MKADRNIKLEPTIRRKTTSSLRLNSEGGPCLLHTLTQLPPHCHCRHHLVQPLRAFATLIARFICTLSEQIRTTRYQCTHHISTWHTCSIATHHHHHHHHYHHCYYYLHCLILWAKTAFFFWWILIVIRERYL